MFVVYGLYLNTRSYKVVSYVPYAIVHFVQLFILLKKEFLLLILWSFFFKKSTLSEYYS